VVAIVGAGLSMGAAAGAALAITGAASGGVASLASGAYSFSQSEKQLSALNLQDLKDQLHLHLTEIEGPIVEADDEIAESIEALRAQWTMEKIAIPAPPGGDEVDIESFHHESGF
jgi:hypothetical protein